MARVKLPFILQSGVRTRGEASVTGLTGVLCAVARYDFAEHGGSIGTKALGVFVPAGAIVYARGQNIITAVVGAGAETAFTLNTDADKLITQYIPDNFDGVGVQNFGSALWGGTKKLEVDTEIKFVIGTAPITAGKVDCYVMFLMPQEVA